MRSITRIFFLAALSIAVAGTAPLRADPAAEVVSFSIFKTVDLAKLAKGDPMVAHGPTMKFPRGIEVESLFILPMPVQRANELQMRWDGARHSELKIFQHVALPRKPTLSDFQQIASAPANSSVKAFVAATEKLNPERPELQMSDAEAKLFSKSDGAAKGAMPANVSAFWSNLLHKRATAYLSGGLPGQPAILAGGKTIRAVDEANELLREHPRIRKQFSALADTMLGGRSNPELYYELFDVEGRAALSLGASYSKAVGEGWQGGTVQFYSSDGFNVMLTFTQLWPVQIDGKPMTLVWRGDFVAANRLGELRGIERSGAAVAMRKEVQKNVTAMVKDLSSKR